MANLASHDPGRRRAVAAVVRGSAGAEPRVPELTVLRIGHEDDLTVVGSTGFTGDGDSRLYVFVKRTLDIVIAAIVLVAALPVLLLIALLVKRTSPGPVLFRQERSGRDHSTFRCLKFRTMVQDAETLLWQDPDMAQRFETSWKLDNDHRVTPFGRWLRKTSLDELPQLINVLRGEMSIVGPRPVQPRELVERFGPWGEVVTLVKPGITSLWAVSGRSNLSYQERVWLEVEYVRRRGLMIDLAIMLRTIPAALSGRGAR